jgi:hypothetical protein
MKHQALTHYFHYWKPPHLRELGDIAPRFANIKDSSATEIEKIKEDIGPYRRWRVITVIWIGHTRTPRKWQILIEQV